MLPPSRFARFGPLGSGQSAPRSDRRAPLRRLRAEHERRRPSCSWIGVGVLVVFFGVAMLAVADRPSARRGARLAGGASRRCRRDARARRTRCATRAAPRRRRAALMIGLALVTPSRCSRRGSSASSRARSSRVPAPTTRSPRRTASRRSRRQPRTPSRRRRASRRWRACAPATAGAFGKSFCATGVDPGVSKHVRLDWKSGTSRDGSRARPARRDHRQGLREGRTTSFGSPVVPDVHRAGSSCA